MSKLIKQEVCNLGLMKCVVLKLAWLNYLFQRIEIILYYICLLHITCVCSGNGEPFRLQGKQSSYNYGRIKILDLASP